MILILQGVCSEGLLVNIGFVLEELALKILIFSFKETFLVTRLSFVFLRLFRLRFSDFLFQRLLLLLRMMWPWTVGPRSLALISPKVNFLLARVFGWHDKVSHSQVSSSFLKSRSCPLTSMGRSCFSGDLGWNARYVWFSSETRLVLQDEAGFLFIVLEHAFVTSRLGSGF